MGADALGQAVMHGCDLDGALEHPKAALDIRQRRVAFDDGGGWQIVVGDQQEVAVQGFGRPRNLGTTSISLSLPPIVSQVMD
jgi:hypothetical protein